MKKYEKFNKFLNNSKRNHIQMTFEEIENILGFSLPKSKIYPAWWSNNPSNNPMTSAWIAAGYKTQNVDTKSSTVSFICQAKDVEASETNSTLTTQVNSPLFGSMRGTTNISEGVDLTDPADPSWGNVYKETVYSTSNEIEGIKHNRSLNISDKIRALDAIGLKRADIARVLGKRYQHVRNVLVDSERKAG